MFFLTKFWNLDVDKHIDVIQENKSLTVILTMPVKCKVFQILLIILWDGCAHVG